jgi:hypothetical protein
MNQALKFHFGWMLMVSLVACVSSESPTLIECREIQTGIERRTSALDSSLTAHLQNLRLECEALSADTLLATDSLLRMRYASLKEAVNNLEYTQAALHTWRDGLIVLPSADAISRGISNPFGESAGDQGVQSTLQSYSDSLQHFEQSIGELIHTTTYERTPTPQP